jgi:hypothetical protein
MYEQIIDIWQTLQVVCDAVATAEITAKDYIKEYHHDADEEFITDLLHDHIKRELQKASDTKLIQDAFLNDLKSALPHRAAFDFNFDRKLRWKAQGLIADIILHNKREEGRTGGDFGIVIVRPRIHAMSDSLVIKKGRESGLLCQAKLMNRNDKWRRLGKNQKKTLPNHLDFVSLVLYSYFDKKRSELNPCGMEVM